MERRLRRVDKLLQSRDFRRVALRGQRTAGRFFVMVAAVSTRTDESDRPRLGLTVSRRVGGAVTRNRVKRRVREWFRHRQGDLPRGQDLVVIARQGAGDLDTRETAAELDALAARCGRRG